MDAPAILEVFQTHNFLKHLKDWHRMRLAAGLQPFTAKPGEYLARQGEPAHRFYLIQEGHVKVSSRDGAEPGVPLQQVGPGEVVGWSWLVPPHRWRFDCRAVDRVQGVFFDGEWLREQCEADCELGYYVVKHLLAVLASRLEASRLARHEIAATASAGR
jgi:CRP-like cAMP-binding protein